MSKKMMRIFATLLTLAMLVGMVAVVPTVSAAEGGIAENDVIFNLDFSDYVTGGPVVDTVTGTTIMAAGPEAKPDFADNAGVKRDGVYMDGNKATNGIHWTADVLDPMKNTEGGFTLNMWLLFTQKETNTMFFGYSNDITDKRNFLNMWVQHSNDNSISANHYTYVDGANKNVNPKANNNKVYTRNWYMITLTQDPADKKIYLYINGNMENKQEFVSPATIFETASYEGATPALYAIGGRILKSDGSFLWDDRVMGGVMSDVTMYGRALSAGEVSALYNGTEYDYADYTAVDAAIAEAKALNKDNYTPESWANLQAALIAVDEGVAAADQAKVDAYAAAINEAIAALDTLAEPLAISIGISEGLVSANDEGAYNITWNANIALGEGLTFDNVNEQATFTSYGVYYGTTEEAVAAIAAGETVENGRIKYFAQGEDIDVYSIFGFRLKNVAADRTRAAQFFVTYEKDGETFTALSPVASATVAE